MKKEELFDMIGEVDEQKVAAAGMAMAVKKKSRSVWRTWGAVAACVCLVVAGLAVSGMLDRNPTGDDPDAGGTHLDGVDPIIQTIAVFPAEESIENVENAATEHMTKSDAYSLSDLGGYLPTRLPEGYAFESAVLYETTMKDGRKYHMLRAVYSKSTQAEDDVSGENFVVCVTDHKPDTNRRFYAVADVTETVLSETGSQGLYIVYGDIYVGISDMDLPAGDMLSVIHSIGANMSRAEE